MAEARNELIVGAKGSGWLTPPTKRSFGRFRRGEQHGIVTAVVAVEKRGAVLLLPDQSDASFAVQCPTLGCTPVEVIRYLLIRCGLTQSVDSLNTVPPWLCCVHRGRPVGSACNDREQHND